MSVLAYLKVREQFPVGNKINNTDLKQIKIVGNRILKFVSSLQQNLNLYNVLFNIYLQRVKKAFLEVDSLFLNYLERIRRRLKFYDKSNSKTFEIPIPLCPSSQHVGSNNKKLRLFYDTLDKIRIPLSLAENILSKEIVTIYRKKLVKVNFCYNVEGKLSSLTLSTVAKGQALSLPTSILEELSQFSSFNPSKWFCWTNQN